MRAHHANSDQQQLSITLALEPVHQRALEQFSAAYFAKDLTPSHGIMAYWVLTAALTRPDLLDDIIQRAIRYSELEGISQWNHMVGIIQARVEKAQKKHRKDRV